jgi:hypothetical protein
MLQCLGVLSSLGSGSVSDKPTYRDLTDFSGVSVTTLAPTHHDSATQYLYTRQQQSYSTPQYAPFVLRTVLLARRGFLGGHFADRLLAHAHRRRCYGAWAGRLEEKPSSRFHGSQLSTSRTRSIDIRAGFLCRVSADAQDSTDELPRK